MGSAGFILNCPPMKKLAVILLFWRMWVTVAIGQSTIGLPDIRNYKNTDYHAAIEIWDIAQGKNGMLYFANNDGLLSFDGSYWKLYPLPNKAAIKSLAIDAIGRIYVGGQDEIGYFLPDPNGILQYHSLKDLLPTIARQFADIWTILIDGDAVVFRTIETLFRLKDNKMQTFDAPGGWRLLAKTSSGLFAEDKTKGLQVFRNGQLQDACGNKPTADLHITGIMEYKKDTLLVTTLRDGLYLLYGSTLQRLPAPSDPFLRDNMIRNARKIGEDRYALGTSAGGMCIIDNNGQLLQRFSSSEGLQNNNVLTLLSDQDKNLWVGLENGLAFINYNTSVKHIYPVKGNQIMSNAVKIFDRQLFIGTSIGLYSVPLDGSHKDLSSENGIFSEVANTRGQVWSLMDVHQELLVGHQDGAFVIRNHRAIPVSTGQGVWGFAVDTPSADIIAGTYTGLQRINYIAGEFKADGKINDLYESLGGLVMDNNGTVWASHPYRGIYKTPVPPTRETISQYTHYTQKEGLPSDLDNYVYFIRNKIVVATEKGVYEYDSASHLFKPSPAYASIFHDNPVEYLAEDRQGNTWFVSDRRVGVIDRNKPSGQEQFSVIYFPELTEQTVKGAPFIYPYDSENIFIGSNNGIYHLNYSKYIQADTGIKVLLGTVKAIAEKDSLIFGGVSPEDQSSTAAQNDRPIIRLPNHWNSFHFEYSSPLFAQKASVEFCYKLVGFDRDWSEWSGKTEKDYTNLPYGTYTFLVRARNNLGTASQPVSYSFTVDPAWYQTIWAYIGYLLLVLGILRVVSKRQEKKQEKRFALRQKQYEEEQERLNYLHSLELDKKEKAKALATSTMHLVERGGLLLTIKQELMAVIKKLNIPNGAYEFRSVFRMMNDTEKNDDDWNRFAIYFDEVHNNFLSTLKTKFPQLSPTDLKLCAYLRLNLSSKEIAQLLNISLKGVEVSRYRLRKKLNLPSEINLFDYIIEVTS
jgi:ligand-binding sensor domain-containing protein